MRGNVPTVPRRPRRYGAKTMRTTPCAMRSLPVICCIYELADSDHSCGLYLKNCGRARPISLQSTRSRRRAAPRHPTTNRDSGSEPSVSDPGLPQRISPDTATLKIDAEPDTVDGRPEKRRRVSRTADEAYQTSRSGLAKRSSPIASTSREPTTTQPEVQCAHCHSTRSSNRCWVNSKLGGTGKICNACAHYEKRNNRRRPFSLFTVPERGSK